MFGLFVLVVCLALAVIVNQSSVVTDDSCVITNITKVPMYTYNHCNGYVPIMPKQLPP